MPPEPVQLIVCEYCDAVYRRRPLARGESARCVRCNALLYRHQRMGTESMLALSLAALITLLVANSWPIAYVSASGVTSASTLWGAIIAAWHEGIMTVSAIVAVTLFFVPLLQLLLLVWVFAFLHVRRRPPGLISALRMLKWMHPWGMIEVLMLGLLVAVVKLHSVFDLVPGVAMYAFAVLTVLLTLVASYDTRDLWDQAPARAPERSA